MSEEMIDPMIEKVPMSEGKKQNGSIEIASLSEKNEQQEVKGERVSEQYSKILSQVQPGSASTADDEVEEDANAVGVVEEAEKKVHTLVELAQVKGVAHAVRVAKRMNDLYVLDTMHDELADKLYEGLLSKGLITKE